MNKIENYLNFLDDIFIRKTVKGKWGKNMRRKEVWTLIYLMLCMIVLGVVSVSASSTPYGVKGYVLWPNGSQVSVPVSVSVNDTTSGDYVNGTTGGPSGHEGWYSFSVNGSKDDKVIIKAINDTAYAYKEVWLDGDMSSVNLTLEVNNSAPTIGEAYLEVENPSKNMELKCLAKNPNDPRGLAINYNYTWYLNGVEQGIQLHELENDSETLFLARWDSTQNATFARGSSTYLSLTGASIVSDGKIGGALNITDGDKIAFNATNGNFNSSQGTIEFWFKPMWAAGAAPNLIEAFFYSGVGTTDRFRVYYLNSLKKLFFMRASKVISEVVNWDANEWHHVAATWGARYDTTKGSYFTMQRLYLDGKLIAYDDTVISSATMPPEFYIGSYNTAQFPAYSKFDEFRIYGRELTPQEIERDYSTGIINRRFVNASQTWKCEITPFSGNWTYKGATYSTKTVTIENYSVSYSLNDYSNGELNTTLKAGKPSSIYVVVQKDGVPVSNAKVEVVEKNGFSPFAYVQTAETNVTGQQVAVVYTNSSGSTEFTIIPTGGRFDTEETYQFYDLYLDVYVNNEQVYRINLPVQPKDRDVAQMKAQSYPTTASVRNAADFSAGTYTARILNLWARIKYFMGGGND